MKNESKDVLFRIPKSHYFRTRYREMSIPMAPSSEIFIDDISKKSLIFKEKGLDLIGRQIDFEYKEDNRRFREMRIPVNRKLRRQTFAFSPRYRKDSVYFCGGCAA